MLDLPEYNAFEQQTTTLAPADPSSVYDPPPQEAADQEIRFHDPSGGGDIVFHDPSDFAQTTPAPG